MRIFLLVTALIMTSLGAFAQNPAIRAGGVVNAASLATAGLPNSGIAQGGQFAILGTDLGPTDPVLATGFPYPASDGLGGVSVKVTVGGSSADAIMVSVSDKRIVAVLPSTVPVGSGTVAVTYNGNTGSGPVEVVAVNFGIFTRSSAGTGQASAQNTGDDGSLTDNTINTPAKPGSQMVLLGTGLGAVSGDEAAGPITGDVGPDLDVFFGGKKANLISKGRSGSAAGVDQLVVEVPQDLSGCFVAVAVRAAGRVSNFATVAVSSADTCTDPNGFTPAELDKIRVSTDYASGTISLGRSAISAQGFELTSESASASFARVKIDGLVSTVGVNGQPSIGSCIVNTVSDVGSSLTVQITPLDAGPSLTLTGPKGTKSMDKQQDFYSATFTPSLPIPGAPSTTFLDPGQYSVTGPGGADVGPFTANITLGPALNWTNRATVGNAGNDVINRASDVSTTWTGGGLSDLVVILGISSLNSPRVTATFTCIERAPVGQFTVPSWVLSAIPPSNNGILSLSLTSTEGNRFEAPGIDTGFIYPSSSSTRTITFR